MRDFEFVLGVGLGVEYEEPLEGIRPRARLGNHPFAFKLLLQLHLVS